jgi:hypothetical protein
MSFGESVFRMASTSLTAEIEIDEHQTASSTPHRFIEVRIQWHTGKPLKRFLSFQRIITPS